MPTTRARRREDVTARVLEIGRAAPGRARRRRAVAAGGDPRPRHGVVGGLPLRRQPRRAAHPAARRRLRRPGGCRRRGGRRRRRPALARRGSLAAAHAFRAWAVAEPSRYALLYGSPVPGYAAPAEVTNEPGTRVIGVLLGLVAEGVARRGRARRAGAARPTRAAREPTCGPSGPRSGWTPTRPCWRGRCCCGRRSSVVRAWRCSGSTAPTPSATRARPSTSRSDGARRAPRRPRPALSSAKSGALRGIRWLPGHDSAKCS